MALDDLADSKKEEANAVTEEEVEDFADRFYDLEETLTLLAKHVERQQERISSLEHRVEQLEADTTDETEDEDGSGGGIDWEDMS